jgi:hypothetical protein
LVFISVTFGFFILTQLFSTLLSFVTAAKDMITLELPMDAMTSFVLAIVPVRELPKIRDSNPDIKELASEQKPW